ncbi:MAG TPA: DNA polymerase III subunit delta', partial [Aquaticitalea sp.]|nr:DNA polymerase III subunit delta' [Aquaticitalea sp.]
RDSEDLEFEAWFVSLMRGAFKAQRDKSAIHNLLKWSEEMAKTGRETQKKFLLFCLDFFRQAMLLNYEVPQLVYVAPKTENFKLENFAPYVHGDNILQICEELQSAIYEIERNGNSKIIFTDLSIKLTRQIYLKEGS